MAAKKGKILVVDDNAGIRQTLKILLPVHFEEVMAIPSPSTLVSTIESFRPGDLQLESSKPSGSVDSLRMSDQQEERTIREAKARCGCNISAAAKMHNGSVELLRSDAAKNEFAVIFR